MSCPEAGGAENGSSRTWTTCTVGPMSLMDNKIGTYITLTLPKSAGVGDMPANCFPTGSAKFKFKGLFVRGDAVRGFSKKQSLLLLGGRWLRQSPNALANTQQLKKASILHNSNIINLSDWSKVASSNIHSDSNFCFSVIQHSSLISSNNFHVKMFIAFSECFSKKKGNFRSWRCESWEKISASGLSMERFFRTYLSSWT